MKAGEDPRDDQHPGDGTPGKFPTPPGQTVPAPGGAGTGTENDPSKHTPPSPHVPPDQSKR